MNNLFYLNAPVMKDTPSTEKSAKPKKRAHVSNATVLKVETGTYRSAVFSGTFLLDEKETAKHYRIKDGWVTAIVFCLWYGCRLKTRGIALKYKQGMSEIIENYTGEVDADIYL